MVLPDTQNYSEKFPEQFQAQTEWIVDQAKSRRIAAVLHLGDITNRSSEPEWQVASQAMAKLDGTVPYFMIVGNHDYSADGRCIDRTTRYNDYFPVARFKERANFGGTYDREPERMENSYQTFDVGGRKFLVLSLEFGPRQDVVRWANQVAARHSDREAILLTHAYMFYDDTATTGKGTAPNRLGIRTPIVSRRRRTTTSWTAKSYGRALSPSTRISS